MQIMAHTKYLHRLLMSGGGPRATLVPHWKGRGGTILMMGGSVVYSGAPYIASSGALRAGAELVYVHTEASAAAAIKSMMPDLCVHPSWHGSPKLGTIPESPGVDTDGILATLERSHVVVIGPGLGRADGVLAAATTVIEAARQKNVPIVLDADALFLVSQQPEVVREYGHAVLTPNGIEFQRLWHAAMGTHEPMPSSTLVATEALSNELGGVTILHKGSSDVITNGSTTIVVDVVGSEKRPGGIGDLLAGCTAAMLCLGRPGSPSARDDVEWSPVLASAAASEITRYATSIASAKYGLGLVATDIIPVTTRAVNLVAELGAQSSRAQSSD